MRGEPSLFFFLVKRITKTIFTKYNLCTSRKYQPLAAFEPHIFLNLKHERMTTYREEVKISILESLGFPQPELIDLTDDDLQF